ncbi:polysaccharide biosynthesis tyrosine autokinase [bacterium]|nr:MAG: polysaccharide biosynthesis tyrosine autokinase [bacterium]
MKFGFPSDKSDTKSNKKKVVGINAIFKALLYKWKLFVISILCCLSFTFLYNYVNHVAAVNSTNIKTPHTEFKNLTIYIFDLTIGIFLPAVFLLIKELLNIHLINTKADVCNITSVPIIGMISHKNDDENLVVNKAFHSIISEEFNRICINLQFNLNKKSNILLFTSSMSGEGKSFLSLNLGSALALRGKKVIFLEFDLRKPKLSERIGVDNNYGFTNYITSDNVTIESIIKPLWFHENCFIISSGFIPPNPTEIWASAKVEILMNALKKQFEYVIIDCAPVGVISDVLMIEKLADLTLYVIRQKYTYKSQLSILNDLQQTGKFKKLYLIMNDNKSKENKVNYFKKYFYNNCNKKLYT